MLRSWTGAFWFLLDSGSSYIFYVLYVWTGLVATVVVVQFWVLMGSIVTVTQAKRVFGIVTAGGLVGATLGSGIAFQSLSYLDTRDLLWVASGFLFLTSVVPLLSPEPVRDSSKKKSAPAKRLQLLRSQPYLRRLAAVVFLSTVVFTGVDFIFKFVISDLHQGVDLGQYLARFYLVVNAIALLAQLVLTRWAITRMGVSSSAVVLPTFYLRGCDRVMLGPAMATSAALGSLLFLKGSDGALKHSLHRTAMEVLYFPVPVDVRNKFKAFIDVVGQRGGQAVASLADIAVVYGVRTDRRPLGGGRRSLRIFVDIDRCGDADALSRSFPRESAGASS